MQQNNYEDIHLKIKNCILISRIIYTFVVCYITVFIIRLIKTCLLKLEFKLLLSVMKLNVQKMFINNAEINA